MPKAVADLLRQPLLSGWYAEESPQEQQASRTGLLLSATTDEWYAMGWTTKQITKVAHQLLTARTGWIDGITVVHRAIEQHMHDAGQKVTGSAQALGGPRWLERPIYTQCLGFTERPRARVPIPPKVGWVGATQVGPLDEDDARQQDGGTAKCVCGGVEWAHYQEGTDALLRVVDAHGREGDGLLDMWSEPKLVFGWRGSLSGGVVSCLSAGDAGESLSSSALRELRVCRQLLGVGHGCRP